jgi:hypothetical protein
VSTGLNACTVLTMDALDVIVSMLSAIRTRERPRTWWMRTLKGSAQGHADGLAVGVGVGVGNRQIVAVCDCHCACYCRSRIMSLVGAMIDVDVVLHARAILS